MIINLISGPRNISTALMYSFAQRDDTKVIDEPFYGCYLNQFPNLNHPVKSEILSSMPVHQHKVLEKISEIARASEMVFIKNMAHHQIGLDLNYLIPMKNVFLIRNPKQLIASFAQVIENPTLQDIGLKEEADVLDFVEENSDFKPLVVDSNSILKNPEIGLKRLCMELNIPFSNTMLSWKKGPIPEDGVWAKYWYKNVHNSTGFAKQSTSERVLPDHCQALYDEALPYYNKLNNYSLKF